MTINRAMQLEEVNNELIGVLLGLTARVRTAVKMLKEEDHEHPNVVTLLSTFQAETLLERVATTTTEGVLLKKGEAFQGFADMARSELQGEKEAAEPFLMRYAHPVIQEELDAHGNWIAAKVTGFQSREQCHNLHCVDGLAPRKTGPDDGDVEMEPCPACGGPQ